MPTGSLGGEGKALWERVYDKALKGSCKGDKECASRTAWSAVKGAGWSKDSDGNWHKKAVLSEFSLYISKASFNKTEQKMKWYAVASDTDEDFFKDNMTESLFEDFVSRIETNEVPPEKYRSEFWSGGNPFMSLSHYPDLEGKAVPGVVERVYKDGNRLKAYGYFLDTPLGRACFKSVCKDLYGDEKHPDGDVRISIAFLDYAHKHKSNGFMFQRSEAEPICMECVRGILQKSDDGLEFLKGHLIHLALTRVPANARTLIEPLEVNKMAINTRKDDAMSIIGEDEEVRELVEEISEEASLVGKSELVIKSETEEVEEAVEETILEVTEETEQEVVEESTVEKSEFSVEHVMKAITELKSELAEMKSAPATPEPHALDSIFNVFKTAYDATLDSDMGATDKLKAIQEPFNALGDAIVASIKSELPSDEPESKSEVPLANQIAEAISIALGPTLTELKASLEQKSVVIEDGKPVEKPVRRYSINPPPSRPATSQETLQKPEGVVKSLYDLASKSTGLGK